eukprot:TRINITY_DN3305_c0_g2_i2.p1 TRINITY_DN3305_c0_g2~~TRINITY_DN3305_c0_g2_i2.p1  ORF type:complete len:331 (+),score=40.52 TRINITY_DN3305_c0_g2_i2:61-993(+)
MSKRKLFDVPLIDEVEADVDVTSEDIEFFKSNMEKKKTEENQKGSTSTSSTTSSPNSVSITTVKNTSSIGTSSTTNSISFVPTTSSTSFVVPNATTTTTISTASDAPNTSSNDPRSYFQWNKKPAVPIKLMSVSPKATTTTTTSTNSKNDDALDSNKKKTDDTQKLIVNERQRQNPILKHIRHVRYDFSDKIDSDYVLSAEVSALFLSIRFHLLKPQYITGRIESWKKSKTNVIICLIDTEEYMDPLTELNKMCIDLNLTLIVTWSNQEAARYLESFRVYANKSIDTSQKDESLDSFSQVRNILPTLLIS